MAPLGFRNTGSQRALRNCLQLFRSMAYRARKREDLLRALDDFFSGAFVIPPGQWDPAIRLEPPQHVQSRVSCAILSCTLCLTRIRSIWASELCSALCRVRLMAGRRAARPPHPNSRTAVWRPRHLPAEAEGEAEGPDGAALARARMRVTARIASGGGRRR